MTAAHTLISERSPSRDELPEEDFGAWRPRRRLGIGGMGAVYLVEHRRLHSLAAVKVLHEHLVADPEGLQRFMTETEAVSRFNHPGIVSIFDVGTTSSGQPWFAMEYVSGTTIDAELTHGPFTLERTINIVSQLASALDRAHLHGVIHRDLKPANVMLTRSGQLELVKVVDFGIAKLRGHTQRHTVNGAIIGTPDYMSPEQILGGAVDERTDVYALGAMTHELLVGTAPFGTRGVSETLRAHLHELPALASASRAEIPEGVGRAVQKALAKKPEHRFASAGAFAEALRRALGPPAPRPAATTPAPSNGRRARLVIDDVRTPVVCTETTVAGCFVSSALKPALLSPVTLFLEDVGELSALVVRHVESADAARWGRPAGFFLQFHELTSRQRLLLEGGGDADELLAAEQLARWRDRFWSNAYAVLDVPLDASMQTLAKAFGVLDAELSVLEERALSPTRRREVDAARERLTAVWSTIGSTAKRARYDASIANWRGVAECLRAGLPEERLNALHDEFFHDAPEAAQSSLALAQRSCAALTDGQPDSARTHLEAALTIDPLNVVLHDTWRILAQLEA